MDRSTVFDDLSDMFGEDRFRIVGRQIIQERFAKSRLIRLRILCRIHLIALHQLLRRLRHTLSRYI